MATTMKRAHPLLFLRALRFPHHSSCVATKSFVQDPLNVKGPKANAKLSCFVGNAVEHTPCKFLIRKVSTALPLDIFIDKILNALGVNNNNNNNNKPIFSRTGYIN